MHKKKRSVAWSVALVTVLGLASDPTRASFGLGSGAL